MTFFFILLPIFSVFVIGYVAQKILHFDTGTLSKMSLYLLIPFLAFNTFYNHPLSIAYLYYALYSITLLLTLLIAVTVWSKIMGYNENNRCALILSSCFMNVGNYGLPVIAAFFGPEGFQIAVVIMVFQQLLMATVGIYYAAKGSSNHDDTVTYRTLFRIVLRMPIAYSALVGILFQQLHIHLTESIEQTITALGNAAVVMIMLILGMQLANIKTRSFELGKISFALILKLLISPAIAFTILLFLPLDLLTKQIFMVLASMPTAANTTLMAVNFNTRPNLASTITLLGCLLSLITLPLILTLVHQPIF